MDRASDAAGPIVTAIGPRGFKVGEEHHPALLMTVDRAEAWTPPPLAELTVRDLGVLIKSGPEFILLGSGATLVRPSAALVRELDAAGLGIEPMDSRAAVRAWGVLRGEGRRIAAAIYPLG